MPSIEAIRGHTCARIHCYLSIICVPFRSLCSISLLLLFFSLSASIWFSWVWFDLVWFAFSVLQLEIIQLQPNRMLDSFTYFPWFYGTWLPDQKRKRRIKHLSIPNSIMHRIHSRLNCALCRYFLIVRKRKRVLIG